MLRIVSLSLATGMFVLCSCARLSESSITGTWRTETTEIVKEIALRSDHTFTAWTDAKNDLTTPNCLTSAGEWKLQHRNILIHLTTHLDIDGWRHEDEHLAFTVVKVNQGTMQLKDSQQTRPITYQRLFPDYSLEASRRTPVDRDLFGIWRVHYNTRDYEMVLGQDHSFGVFARLPDWRQPAKDNVQQQLWTGTWRLAHGKLLTDADNVPSFDGESIQTRHGQWPIVEFERDRIAVRDGPVRYLWERTK